MGYPKLFFDNRLSDAAPVASSTAAGDFAAANVSDMRPYTWWQPTALPATLRVDSGAAKAADSLAIYGHDLFTQGATLEVHGSTDNFVASDVLIGTITPGNNNPFLLEFASANYRYWEIRITGTTMPSIAIIVLGAAFVMPKLLTAGYDPLGTNVVGQSNNNDNGTPLGAIIDFEQHKQTLTFSNVTYAWLRASWLPAWKSYLRGSPFIFGWDTVNYPAEIQLLTMDYTNNPPSMPHQQGGLATLSFDVQGVAT